MTFNQFKEKYFGKDLEYIIDEIKKEDIWKKRIDILSLCGEINEIINEILGSKKDFITLYLFQKEVIKFNFILKEVTKIKSVPDGMLSEDFDINVFEALYKTSSYARFINKMIEDGLQEVHIEVLEGLYEIFGKNTPTAQELNDMAEQFGGMFKEESPEKLDLIKKILEFNDPTIKQVRDEIFENETIKQVQQGLEEQSKTNKF